MAAAEFNKLLFVMRTASAGNESSPAILRLLLEPGLTLGAATLQVHILKRRGPPLSQPIVLQACAPVLARLLAAAQPVVREGPYVLDRAAALV